MRTVGPICVAVSALALIGLFDTDRSSATEASAGSTRSFDFRDDCVILTLTKDGSLFGEGSGTKLDTTARLQAFLDSERGHLESLSAVRGKKTEIVLVIRADRDCRYGRFWEVVDCCKKSGFSRWRLIVTSSTEPEMP
jgi:biopolymer transport protein ExbD